MGKDKFDSVAPIVRDNTGSIALETAIKALKGESVPKILKLPRDVITSADIDKYVKPDLPDSFWCGSNLPDGVVKQLFTK